MIEIKTLVDRKILMETLQRIGIANFDTCIIYPSAYLIRLEDKDYIAHFKELFQFINNDAYDNMEEQDEWRLNSICFLLQNWKLIECLEEILPHGIKIDVIKFEDKKNWLIKHKIKLRNLEGIIA